MEFSPPPFATPQPELQTGGDKGRCVLTARENGRKTSPLLVPALSDSKLESLASLKDVFASAPRVGLYQAWLTELESGFLPAEVRLGWRGDRFIVLATLEDRDIFNTTRSLNERAWLNGDVFEIFLQEAGKTRYTEFHITPENQRGQYVFRGPDQITDPIVLDDLNAIYSRVWVEPENQRWSVYAEIPRQIVSGEFGNLEGREWRFSFSRYDYTRGENEPVLSSSSAHQELNFHRIHEWNMINFV